MHTQTELFPVTTPQLATDRYVTFLLQKGRNDDYTVTSIIRQPIVHNNIEAGQYYVARISCPAHNPASPLVHYEGAGPTPQFALRSALLLAGVTFK